MPYATSNKEIQEAHMGGVGKYKQYAMPAGGKYNNSPIEKNFGSPAQRGVGDNMAAFGTKSKEVDGGVSSSLLMASPNKVGEVAAPGVEAQAPPQSHAAKAQADADAAAAAAAQAAEVPAAGGETPEVPPHGEESHTSGGAVGGEEKPWEVMKAGAFSDMSRGERKDYMGGLNKKQKIQQIGSNLRNRRKGQGMFGMGGFSGMFSDIRLKENIERTGTSESGIPMYDFNYIGDDTRYSGAMAQDLLDTNAVSMHESGYYMVDYNNIDVDMKMI